MDADNRMQLEALITIAIWFVGALGVLGGILYLIGKL